jgi:hypothetical protein
MFLMVLKEKILSAEEQRAYLAGYFDAEGCVSVDPANRGTTWSAIVTFGQVNPTVPKMLHERYGSTLTPVPPQRPTWRPKTVFTTRRWRTVQRILRDVLPYVREKRSQVEAVLANFNSRMSASAGRELQQYLQAEKKRVLPRDTPVTTIRDRTRRCALCSRRARARGLCTKHYQSERNAGRLPRIQNEEGRLPFKYRRTPTPTELAYIAGYFDGDGTFEIQKRSGTWYVGVSFNQTQPEGVRLVADLYGGSLRFRRPRTSTRRPQLRYYLGQQEAVFQFLADVRPRIHEKTPEVEAFFAMFSTNISDSAAMALRRKLTTLRSGQRSSSGSQASEKSC